MSKNINLGDLVYHPMSVDIIEFKVISINQKLDQIIEYQLRSTHNVGACGILEIAVVPTDLGYLTYKELITCDNEEYSSGLGDFIEGKFYLNRLDARLKYYELFIYNLENNMDNKFQIYLEAKRSYDKSLKIIN